MNRREVGVVALDASVIYLPEIYQIFVSHPSMEKASLRLVAAGVE